MRTTSRTLFAAIPRRFAAFSSLLWLLTLVSGCPRRVAAQTPVTLNPYQRQQFFDSNGKPLASGCVFTYQAGTSTPLATYTDSTGMFQNANPLILDGSGYGVLWLTANAYRFVLFSSGGVNCASGTQQWLLDFVTPAPFLGGANAWTGSETHAGTELFSAAVTLNGGGSFNGTITGSPTLSGSPNFSGTPTFANNEAFPGGITTDAVTGTLTNGSSGTVTGANGSAGNNGEGWTVAAGNGNTTGNGGGLNINAGVGGATGVGGTVALRGGSGGATSGAAGEVDLFGGLAQGGNANGGRVYGQGGTGAGTGGGGGLTFVGGTGGNTSGLGGPVSLTAGAGGAGGNGGDVTLAVGTAGAGGANGSLVLGQDGRVKMAVTATGVAPTCSSTGLGASGTCTLENYSTDTSGGIVLTPQSGSTTTGTITMTYKQTMGPNGSFCVFNMANNGSGQWNGRATVFAGTGATATATAFWDNNAVGLTGGSTYLINYWCRGEN